MAKGAESKGAGGERSSASTLGKSVTDLVQRIERIEEEKKGLSEDVRDLKAAIRNATGFSGKAVGHVLKLRAMEQSEREDFEAEVDALKALLGDLMGTPMGDAAVNKFERARQMKYPDDHQKRNEEAKADFAAPAPERHNDTVDQAREKGRAAGLAGVSVRLNPYPPHDPCRAAWDEGWVQSSKLTGMEVPDAWKRPKKDEDKKGEPPKASDAGASATKRAAREDDDEREDAAEEVDA